MRSGEKIKLTSIDELLGVPNEEAMMKTAWAALVLEKSNMKN